MSQTTLELVRNSYDALSSGDLDAAFATLGPDFELIPPDEAPVDGPLGLREAKAWLADLWEMVGNPVIEVERLIDTEDSIVALIRLQVRPHGADSGFEQRIAHVWTVRETRLTRCQVFLEREKALEAVGLSQQDAGTALPQVA